MLKPEPSRRALLAGGALAGVATVAAIPATGPADAVANSADLAANWRAAMVKVDASRADYARAQAAFNVLDENFTPGFHDAHRHELDALEEAAQAAFETMRDAEAEALALPAPDAAALQFKAALWTEGLQDDLISPQCLKRRVLWAYFMADAVRLAGDSQGGAAWRAEAAAVQARGDLTARITAAGGYAYRPRDAGSYGPIAWAPNPPADTDRAALAIERADIESAFAPIAHTFTGRDFEPGVHKVHEAWGGTDPYRRGGEASTPAEQAAERNRKARVTAALDLCAAAPVLMRWRGRDDVSA